ncbi:MAG: quinolinate synthase NadA [Alphaproteobacteria bacterium]|nr:quinolinate synthase NadA [Alphaproteobacteria bacterium]
MTTGTTPVWTDEVAEATAPIYEKLADQYQESHWRALAPYIFEINRLKKEKNAIILAHNYMTPDIFHGVADIVGDSLALARKASKTDADIICQATVLFMAETSKILCPDKIILQPDMDAGCSLADSITPEDVRALRKQYPGLPIIAYVNTSAEVKAEVDVCCTSSNAIQIVNAMDTDEVVMLPDMYLAKYAAEHTSKTVHSWKGSCIVHERFTAADMKKFRADYEGAKILAHPECPPEVLHEADYAGSTAQMIDYVEKHKPARVVLVTECSMSDNVAAEHPDIELVRPCQLCPHMKRITLPKILKSLQTMTHEVHVDPEVSARARKPIERMLELSA